LQIFLKRTAIFANISKQVGIGFEQLNRIKTFQPTANNRKCISYSEKPIPPQKRATETLFDDVLRKKPKPNPKRKESTKLPNSCAKVGADIYHKDANQRTCNGIRIRQEML
jgi:hypothetical protein